MYASLTFTVGLLNDFDPPVAAAEDLQGPHGEVLRGWQRQGFLAAEPEPHRVPSCPHCRRGPPVRADGRLICAFCLSDVDPQHLCLWRFDLEALLVWVAGQLKLEGGVRSVADGLWQIGSLADGQWRHECFFRRGGQLTDSALARIRAYRNVIVLHGDSEPAAPSGQDGPEVSLLDILEQDGRSLRVRDPLWLLHGRGTVHFEPASGSLWVGDVLVGEVPVGSKDYYLLACLADQLDRYVTYADLKHEVLRQSRSRDTTDEATFCQKLKGRIKKKWVPGIDRFIVTTNKGDGYRLRGHVEPSEDR